MADIWDVSERGIPMALFSSMIFLGPCLGPLFGGWIAFKTGQWRWIYWVLFIFVGCVFVLTCLMPETLGKVILKRKGVQHARVPIGQTLKIALVRPFQLMFFEPIVLCMSFYLSFVYSLLYATFFA